MNGGGQSAPAPAAPAALTGRAVAAATPIICPLRRRAQRQATGRTAADERLPSGIFSATPEIGRRPAPATRASTRWHTFPAGHANASSSLNPISEIKMAGMRQDVGAETFLKNRRPPRRVLVILPVREAHNCNGLLTGRGLGSQFSKPFMPKRLMQTGRFNFGVRVERRLWHSHVWRGKTLPWAYFLFISGFSKAAYKYFNYFGPWTAFVQGPLLNWSR